MALTLIIFTLAMGFNFVGLLGYYIPIFYIFEGNKEAAGPLLGLNGTIWAITGLLAVFPLNFIAPKIGKQKTLMIAIALMCLSQLSKIVCYNQEYPYLIIIPTILLSIGMLFFFTLGSSMVGDICDEDELKTGNRAEGSYYSIFWWFIKMGTAFASFVTGLLITFVNFDEGQVQSVDKVSGAVKEIRVAYEDKKDTAALKEKLLAEIAKFEQHIKSESKAEDSHKESLLKASTAVKTEFETKEISSEILDTSLDHCREMTLQSPKTLFLMRAVEIGLPLLLCLVSFILTLKYPLTEERCLEIQEKLKLRKSEA